MSRRRKIFDIAVGIVMPIFFIIVDPAVFRSSQITGISEPAYLGAFKALSYAAIGIASAALSRVIVRQKLDPLVAGLLGASSLLAGGLGIALIPISILGTFFFGLGLLGFSPFLAAVVYARAAMFPSHDEPWNGKLVLAGFGVFFVACLGAQLGTNRAVDWAIENQNSVTARAVLRAAPILYDPDQMVWQYQAEPTRQPQLAAAYRQMTNTDIADRVNAMAD